MKIEKYLEKYAWFSKYKTIVRQWKEDPIKALENKNHADQMVSQKFCVTLIDPMKESMYWIEFVQFNT